MKNWLDDLVEASPVSRHVAWAGELEFQAATESDSAGRTVQFILRRQQKELHTAHPFSAHTRRRRGHAGTTFEVSLAALDAVGTQDAFPTGLIQMMLLNWASGPKGDTAKFMLDFSAEKHPFLGCTRAAKDQPATRWMAAFIEVDDQSAPVDQVQRAVVEKIAKPRQQIKNSNLAAQFIKNPLFWNFAEILSGEHVSNALEADGWLKLQLGITSKAELDSSRQAGVEFDHLRQAFVDWQIEAGIDVTQ